MHFVTHTKTLKEVAETVAQVVTKKSTLPVLSHLLIEAKDDGTVRVIGTDLETYFVIWFNADVREPGAICLPRDPLVNALTASLKSCNLEVKTEERTGKCQLNAFRLNGLDAQEFPPTPMSDKAYCTRLYDSEWSKLWTHELYSVLHRVNFARSTDEARPILTGINFGIRATNKLVATSTDGYMIATNDQLEEACKEDAILYGKALSVIDRCMKAKDTTPMRLINWLQEINKSKYRFVTLEWRLMSKDFTAHAMLYVPVMDGVFPPYWQVIPKEPPFRLSMPKAPLVDALDSVLSLTKGTKVWPTTHMALYHDHLLVYASSEDNGEVFVNLPCEINLPEGLAYPVAFNARMMLDILESEPGAQVYVRFKYNNNPFVFVFPNGYRCVLMPMQNDTGVWPTDVVTVDQLTAFNEAMKEMVKADEATWKAAHPDLAE